MVGCIGRRRHRPPQRPSAACADLVRVVVGSVSPGAIRVAPGVMAEQCQKPCVTSQRASRSCGDGCDSRRCNSLVAARMKVNGPGAVLEQPVLAVVDAHSWLPERSRRAASGGVCRRRRDAAQRIGGRLVVKMAHQRSARIGGHGADATVGQNLRRLLSSRGCGLSGWTQSIGTCRADLNPARRWYRRRERAVHALAAAQSARSGGSRNARVQLAPHRRQAAGQRRQRAEFDAALVGAVKVAAA